jgi:hypothetical protein
VARWDEELAALGDVDEDVELSLPISIFGGG